jgi:hypothetical protein
VRVVVEAVADATAGAEVVAVVVVVGNAGKE